MRRVDQRDTAVLPPAYQGYARRFAEVSAQLRRTMEQFGLPLAQDDAHELAAARKRLVQAGAHLRNDGKSIVYGALSPACERCRTGERSVSQFISLACPRNCWFCFNANQFDYNEYRSNRKDWRVEMDAYAQSMGKLDYVALTGGEPLLYPDEACAFFAYAKRLNPQAHCRLYTSGWGAGRGLFERLAESGLDEIRFSVKIDAETSTNREAPQAESLERQVSRISLAVGVVPSVMVEMPVVPGEQDTLRTVMRRLDDMGAFGINLLDSAFRCTMRQVMPRAVLRCGLTRIESPTIIGMPARCRFSVASRQPMSLWNGGYGRGCVWGCIIALWRIRTRRRFSAKTTPARLIWRLIASPSATSFTKYCASSVRMRRTWPKSSSA